MQPDRARSFLATAFHAPARDRLEHLSDVLIELDGEGRIARVLKPADPGYVEARYEAKRDGRLVEFGTRHVLVPGLVDLHIHAPQWAQLGKALDEPLEVWLQKYTFPLEARFADTGFATAVYESLVENLIANGTTTAVYFATIHREASLALARICARRGQRALVGRVAMDDPDQCPPYYRDASAEASVAETRAFIDGVRALEQEEPALVQPVITPRFLPSCTDAALEGLGRLAAECECHVQTHCSESDWEVGYVRSRFGRTDAEVLDRFGLLREGAVLAHSNLVTASDLGLIAERGSAIGHCPLSNAYFANAVLPVRQALDAGARVGLGTDISGGYSPSIFEAARHAMVAARLLESGVDPTLLADERGTQAARITAIEAFWLATAGGGEAIGLPVGRFEPGCHFDALVLDLDAPGSNIVSWPGLDTPRDLFEKIVLHAGRQNVAAVWVGGRLRHGAV